MMGVARVLLLHVQSDPKIKPVPNLRKQQLIHLHHFHQYAKTYSSLQRGNAVVHG